MGACRPNRRRVRISKIATEGKSVGYTIGSTSTTLRGGATRLSRERGEFQRKSAQKRCN